MIEATAFDATIVNNKNFKSYKAELLETTVAEPNPNQANGILKNTID